MRKNNSERQAFFQSCITRCDFEGEERKRWLAVFTVLRNYNRKQLLAMVNNDPSLLRHSFNWQWYQEYQRKKQAQRRASRKTEKANLLG